MKTEDKNPGVVWTTDYLLPPVYAPGFMDSLKEMTREELEKKVEELSRDQHRLKIQSQAVIDFLWSQVNGD
jgi:hypothetical protein